MTIDQIRMLLKDEDIWLEYSTKYTETISMYFTDRNTKTHYAISNKLSAVIKSIYAWYFNQSVSERHADFRNAIANKIVLLSPLLDDRLNFYKGQLQYQNDELIELVGEIDESKNIDDLLSVWSVIVLENGMELVETIKFKMLNGAKIETFTFGKSGIARTPNFYLLDEFFLSVTMKELYTIAAVGENIKYLQKSIEYNKSKANNSVQKGKPTHRDNAVARLYMEKADPELKKLERRELKEKNFEIALNNISYFGLTKSRTAKEINDTDLERVLEYKLLSSYPNALKIAIDDFQKLRTIKS